MPRSLSFILMGVLLAALPAAGQSQGSGSPQPPPPPPQDSPAPADTKPPKKAWTNENISGAAGSVSVVGDPKSKPKSGTARPANEQYVANTKKQLEKLQKQIDDCDQQIVDLKNFSAGESGNNASGIRLNNSYNREPIEVQIRVLENRKKDLQSQIDALLDEARKKGVEPGQLR